MTQARQLTFQPTERASLLVADFYANVPDLPHAAARGALQNLQRLLQAARAANALVVYCATVFRAGYVEISDRNPLFAPKKMSGLPAVIDAASLLHPDIAPLDGEVVIGKHRVSAFHGTSLDLILRANSIDTLIVAGFATRGVVLSTVRQAADMDYRLIVAEDCCVERDAATHDFLVKDILSMQAEIASASAIAQALPKTSA